MKKVLFKGIEEKLIEDLSVAKKEIKIAVAWFTNHRLFEVLCQKAKTGIKVSTILIYDPINFKEGGLEWKKFIKSGGTLYISKHPNIMHHKFCLIDNAILYNGSYNWTYSAEYYNIENTIRFKNEKNLNQEFESEFERVKEKVKKAKKIKKFSFEELIQWYSNNPFTYYMAKDLEINVISRKSLDPNEALHLIETAIQLKQKESLTSLKNLKNKIALKYDQHQTLIKLKTHTRDLSEKLNKVITEPVLKTKKARPFGIQIGKFQIESKNKAKRYSRMIQRAEKNTIKGRLGQLRVLLLWDTKDDLDLHVIDPCRNHIHYGEMEHECKKCTGMLDVDANVGEPLVKNACENIFWENNPPTGKYEIFVKHFRINEAEEVPFILSIISKIGDTKIIAGKVSKSKMETVKVAEFIYQRKKGVVLIKELLEKSKI